METTIYEKIIMVIRQISKYLRLIKYLNLFVRIRTTARYIIAARQNEGENPVGRSYAPGILQEKVCDSKIAVTFFIQKNGILLLNDYVPLINLKNTI